MLIRTFIKNNLFLIFSCALMMALVLFRKATPYFIGLWFLSAVYESFQNKDYSFHSNLKWSLLIASLFFLYLMGFLFSDFTRDASKALEIKASFLIFPLGFFLRRKSISTKDIYYILFAFQVGCFLSATYLFSRFLPEYFSHSPLFTDNGFTYAFRTFGEKTLGVHATYLSIFYLLSIFIQLKIKEVREIVKNKKIAQVFNLAHVLILSIFSLLLVARAPLLAFLVGFAAVEMIQNWKRGLSVLIAGIVLLVVAVLFVPSIGNRFKEAINSTEVTENAQSVNSSSLRKSIFNCSKKVISENWVMGVGLDNIQNELNECYDSYNNTELSTSFYNSHNQYFDLMLGLGILGLISFLMIQIFPFNNPKALTFSLLLFFKVFMAICFLTENILNRQHGVVFFVFFNCILISNYLWQKKQDKT